MLGTKCRAGFLLFFFSYFCFAKLQERRKRSCGLLRERKRRGRRLPAMSLLIPWYKGSRAGTRLALLTPTLAASAQWYLYPRNIT